MNYVKGIKGDEIVNRIKRSIFNISNKQLVFLIALFTIAGFILRVLCSFWGFPYQLHPDEPTIVDNTIDMLSRHSWEAFVYNRPDQFEIKCNAIIFTAFSWLKYHMPAHEAFASHTGAFYLLARLFTVFWGTAMIPLMGAFVGKILKSDCIKTRYAQLAAVGMITFSAIFVQHSSLATPDIPLAFFLCCLLMCLCGIWTVENENIYI